MVSAGHFFLYAFSMTRRVSVTSLELMANSEVRVADHCRRKVGVSECIFLDRAGYNWKQSPLSES